jgi:hypothetical protein
MSSATSAYRAILAQLVVSERKRNDILDSFAFTMMETSVGQLHASKKELIELLRLCLLKKDSVYIILDAMDECEEGEVFVQDILPLTNNSSAKFLFFSRMSSVTLNHYVPKEQRLQISKPDSSKDIKLYIDHGIETLMDEELLPATTNVTQVADHLLKGADGMFLWARLMLIYLKSVIFTPALRISIINRVVLPDGLEAMYERIVSIIGRTSRAEQDFVRTILLWVSYARQPWSTAQLQEALTFEEHQEPGGDDAHKFANFDSAVTMACANLIEVYPQASGVSFRFIHLSAREFFIRNCRCLGEDKLKISSFISKILPVKPVAEIYFTSTCLKYLTFHCSAQPLSGKLTEGVSQERLKQDFPLADYASLNWISHLKGTAVERSTLAKDAAASFEENLPPMAKLLSVFIHNQLVVTAWLEIFYTSSCGQHPPGRSLQEWSDWAGQDFQHLPYIANVCRDLRDFGGDLVVIIKDWGERLPKSPELVWNEMNSFTKSSFFVRPSTTVVEDLTAKNPGLVESSIMPLCAISRSTPESSVVIDLSIWPSK